MLAVLDNFLPADAFSRLCQITLPQRGGANVYGELQDQPFLAPLLREAARRFPLLRGYVAQQALLRFEGRTGLLHHDLNHRPERRVSLLFYLEASTRGGELVFPFFDASGAPTSNPVTAACSRLYAQETYYTAEPALEAYLVANRDALLTFRPIPNTLIVFPSQDPAFWHFACPVEEGIRACIVVFYNQP